MIIPLEQIGLLRTKLEENPPYEEGNEYFTDDELSYIKDLIDEDISGEIVVI